MYTCRPPPTSISQLRQTHENDQRQVVQLVHKQVIHSWTHLGGRLTPKELWNLAIHLMAHITHPTKAQTQKRQSPSLVWMCKVDASTLVKLKLLKSHDFL
jgi:hypothetical protein